MGRVQQQQVVVLKMNTPYTSIIKYYRDADRAYRHGFSADEAGIERYKADVSQRWSKRAEARTASICDEWPKVMQDYQRIKRNWMAESVQQQDLSDLLQMQSGNRYQGGAVIPVRARGGRLLDALGSIGNLL